MKKFLKILLASFVILIVTMVIIVNYDAHFSNKAVKGENNLNNIRKVKIGMTENEMISIMGKPDTIFTVYSKIYCYDINNDSYVYGKIHIDSNLRVSDIFYPK